MYIVRKASGDNLRVHQKKQGGQVCIQIFKSIIIILFDKNFITVMIYIIQIDLISLCIVLKSVKEYNEKGKYCLMHF